MPVTELEIKQLIIETLNLEDVSPDDIDSEAALFGEGLGLDSIDALELGVALKKRYNITVNADDPDTPKHFTSVNTLKNYINNNNAG
ncbi:MAG: acyl carrier protein [Gammaproteobacteria bacterium CG11_big_fil_rev_8_21_14_0_20_46_22]|nr:MAG: acyl carrier protein [Gammaproteobacteria bacterium CG12_big_fil_rev_8_21_14_0_65_46_12]PIR10078.1 MAG: acyl carrier protein [Gammaproteobacteria bacterium CG11_big_fil_rev_8_21_14_0_20_46_22]